VIPRYRVPEIDAVWADETRLANWLEIELLAVEALAELGSIPPEDAARSDRPGAGSISG
jgi:adenylosuccinate lyase